MMKAMRLLYACALTATLATVLTPAAGADSTGTGPGAAAKTPEAAPPPGLHERLVKEGIAIDVDLEPLAGDTLREGDPARFRFKITDTLTGEPLPALYPAAWMDLLPADSEIPETEQDRAKSCRERVEGFIGGALWSVPELDLNVYYVLALNEDATISVVDPLFGFGGSKLLEMIFLDSPGEDWEQTADGGRLFVSMPESDRVAVVETADWSVVRNVEVGRRPRRLRLQPDEQYLWATWDATAAEPSGVSVIDIRRLSEVARIETGRGRHEMVFSDDDRFVYVSNETDGTVSVIDVAKLTKVTDVATGPRPASLSFSTIAQAVYVTHPATGTVAVIDAASHQVTARIQAEPGIGAIRFAPGGRFGFAVHPAKNLLTILDAAVNRVVQTGEMEAEPYEVGFSDEMAYVLHRGSETVLMVPLGGIGGDGEPVPVIDFPGGHNPPGATGRPSLAETLIQAPGASAVLVANPNDQSIYFYKEGMAAPMGHFKNYGKTPRAVTVVDRSLQETRPGTYETAAKLRSPGKYSLAFFLDAPRVVHCFDLEVTEDPELAARRQHERARVEILADGGELEAGRDFELEVRVVDPATGEAKEGLADVQVLTSLSPGIWQQRQIATEVGGGLYRARFTPPRPGVYYIFVEIASESLGYGQAPSLILTARGPGSRGEGGGAAGVKE
jgi:YVTN family beta-propeller protein